MALLEPRPLGLGEILDRAVVLFVRNLLAIIAAVAIPYIPFELFQWRVLGDDFLTTKQSLTPAEWQAFGLDGAVGLVVFVFAQTTAAVIAAARYEEHGGSLGDSFRRALRRLPAQLVMNVVAACCLGIVLGVAAVLVLAVSAAVVALGGQGVALVLIIFAALAIVIGVPLIFLFLAYELATIRLSVATPNPFTAIFLVLRETAFRSPVRSFLSSAVPGVIAVGPPLVISSISLTVSSLGVRAFLVYGVGTVASVVIDAFVVAFLVVYDADLRLRYEGHDIASALGGGASTASDSLSARLG